jgi:hypothetical protein
VSKRAIGPIGSARAAWTKVRNRARIAVQLERSEKVPPKGHRSPQGPNRAETS